MRGETVALDTSVVARWLNADPPMAALVESCSEIALPATVDGELLFGALNSGRPAANLAHIRSMLRTARVLVADAETAAVYAEVRAGLKRDGRPIPENDVWIAAACLQHGLPLATADGHFGAVRGLKLVL